MLVLYIFYILSLLSIGFRNYLEKGIFYIDLHCLNKINHVQTAVKRKKLSVHTLICSDVSHVQKYC